MLSPEERASLLAEALDPERRERLRWARRSLLPSRAELLPFLTAARRALAPAVARRRISGRRFLL